MLVKFTIEIEGRQAGQVERELTGSAAEVEEQVRSLVQRGGRIVLENAYLMASREVPARRCCGCRMQSRGQRTITVATTFGPVIVSRSRYRCGTCGAESYPADVLWCCGRHRVSLPLAKRVCQLATIEHFPHLESLLADQHGVTLGHDTILELVHDVGSEAERLRREGALKVFRRAPEAARKIVPEVQPQRIYISCDGIMYCTNLTEPVAGKRWENRLIWQQMKVGCVSWQDASGSWHKRIVWGRESPQEFGAALFDLACRCGYQQAAEKIFAADGGPWCWEIRETYFSAAQGILDWFHVSEHVWAAARLVATDTDEIQSWADQALEQLATAGGSGLVAWLEQERSFRRGRSRRAINQLLDYVRPRTSLTDYPTYRANEWQIGTGMMESTCKQLVGVRLKGPGMHWTEAGALAVTALRATDLNGKWQTFWSKLVLAA
jgi:hypothetical protein